MNRNGPDAVKYLSIYPQPDQTLQKFLQVCGDSGLTRRDGQSPWSTMFSDGANRLLEHDLITQQMQTVDGPAQEQRWCEIGPVVRLKDMRNVAGGRHLTVFEML